MLTPLFEFVERVEPAKAATPAISSCSDVGGWDSLRSARNDRD